MKAGRLKDRLHGIWCIWRESRGVRGLVAASSLAGCLGVAMSLVFIWLTKSIVDAAVGPTHHIPACYIALLAGCLAMQLTIPAARRRIETIAVTRYANGMRARLLECLLRSKWLGRRAMHTADAINRMQKDVDTLASLTCSTVPGILAVMMQLAGAFVFLAFLDVRLALALVLIMPVALAASKIYIRRTRRLTAEIRSGESAMQTFLQESLHHRTLLSTLTDTGMLVDRFNGRQASLTGHILKRADISIYSGAAVTAGFMTGYAVAFLWSAYGLTTGAVSFGMMTAFLQLVGQVQRPAVDLSRRVPAFINASVSLERVEEIVSLPSEDFSEPSIPQGLPVGLRLRDVTYSYPDGDGRKVVEHMSHDFTPGSITAITGPTGAGKTTLLRLLLGLVEPDSGGAAVYCGTQGEHAITGGMRRRMVYVPQGNSLMYGTVRYNLMLGNPGATEAMMAEALTTAAAGFVMDLPAGLDTECFEGGGGLSEGQAQRIAIARGLLKGGGILLLDEPTSALDAATEEVFMARLVAHIPSTATVIIVTHRPKVLEYCTDVIELTI